MAHIKALRNKWLAAFAEQQGDAPDAPTGQHAVDQPPQQAAQNQQQPPKAPRQASGGALLPKKRLLEGLGAECSQPEDSLEAKKLKQAELGPSKAVATAADAAVVPGSSAPSQQQKQQRQPKPQHKGELRLNTEGKSGPDTKSSAAPAATAKQSKREGGLLAAAGGGGDAKANRGVAADKAAAKERSKGRADMAATKQGTADWLIKKKERAGEQLVRNEQQQPPLGAGWLAAAAAAPAAAVSALAAGAAPAVATVPAASTAPAETKPVKAKTHAEPNARPLKPAAAKPAAAAAVSKPAAALKQEQQEQEHAGSTPSSMQRADAAANEQPPQQEQQPPQQAQPQQATSTVQRAAAPAVVAPAKPLPSAVEQANGSSSLGTPVEVLLARAELAQHVGELTVAMYPGHCELWEALRSRFADQLPNAAATNARLVYQDSDGDWLLLQPEAPWQVFTHSVRKLVITCK